VRDLGIAAVGTKGVTAEAEQSPYTLKGDKAQFNKWAGQSVTVEGKLSGTALTVETITGSSK
jgi:co-chaperonin GroES (HSP10)